MLASLLPLLPLALTLFSSTLAQTVKYEAEDGTLTGATMTVDTAFPGYSGTGYVTGFEDSTCSLTITVTAASTGLYDFNVTYEAPYGDKYTAVSLNGVSNGELHLPPINNFTTVSGGQLLLNEGTNTITFTDDWGWYCIDYITLAPSAPPAPHQVTSSLTNPNANSITKTLMSFLVSQYGKHILSGQQDPPSYAWVQENIDKSPAIIGLDMIDYSPSRVAFQGNVSHAVEDAISFDGNETIVCFVWHWNAPTNLTNNATEPWYSGFYTAATTFDLATALAEGPNGTDYQLLLRDMDAIAYELGRLQTAGVSVLWRALHEAEGGWFWWGRNQDPTPCIQLYRIMHDRFTNLHGLNNLIWVWNSVSSAWYPGDDVVDILSYDSYPSATGDHGAVSGVYQELVTLGQDKKLIALAEVGEIPDPTLEQAYHADWSYWVTWSGDYISGGDHNSFAFLVSTYWSDYVWNWENIQGWKQGTLITPTTTGIRPTVPATTSTTSSATPSSTVVVPSNAVVYEAENGVFTGTVGVATTATGYSGTGYVAGFATSNDTLTITVTVATAGQYDLYVTYEAPYGLKYTALSVNGVSVGEVYFPANTYFDTVSGGVITLNAGANTITFTNDWGWYFIDKIAIAPDSSVTSSTTVSSTTSSTSVVTSSSKTSSTVTSSSSSIKASSTTSSTKTSSSTKPSSSSSTKISSSTKPTSTSSTKTSSTSVKSSSTSTKTSSSTKASSSTKTSSASVATQTLYGQCGGLTYTGPTVCAAGSHCVYSNDWYSQCLAT